VCLERPFGPVGGLRAHGHPLDLDYTRDREGYLAWARGIERLFNPYPIIEYSTDKHYLHDLESLGHRIVPTSFCDVGAEPVFPDSRFVVKPTVGAGSIDAEKYGHGEHQRARAHVRRLHASGRDAMIQPYVSSIDESGERALVFIDGDFSHAMTKAPCSTPTLTIATPSFAESRCRWRRPNRCRRLRRGGAR